ncbi:MAG: hypothetical protein CM1200mP34_2650 [Verrucomicrobiales bacterium]|nr:MAG: hypothetical protein CM1200mP34_2650 [Verrucomicrobiales bacterium]
MSPRRSSSRRRPATLRFLRSRRCGCTARRGRLRAGRCRIGYQLAGEEPQYISLGADGLATNRLDVAHVLRMEDPGVEVGQVVSYFLWADDRVRDGGVRRGFSDLYFATVRPFEEIFRQNRSATEGMRQQQQQGEGGEQGGEQQQSIANMLDTQKEIISATWNLSAPMPTTKNWPTTLGSCSIRRRNWSALARAGVGAAAGRRVRRPGVPGQRGDAGRRRPLGQGEGRQRRCAWPSAFRGDRRGANRPAAPAETARE